MEWLKCQDGSLLNLNEVLSIRVIQFGHPDGKTHKVAAYTSTVGSYITIFAGAKEDCELILMSMTPHLEIVNNKVIKYRR